jgi:RNA polymerase sigma factor (sigma-70 family)
MNKVVTDPRHVHVSPCPALDESDSNVAIWDEIVSQYFDKVYRLAYGLTGNRPDAEDLAQDLFVRVFRYLPTYTPGAFEGWLHRITINLFLDQQRRTRRIRFESLAGDAADRIASPEFPPDRVIEDRDLDADVQAVLNALAPTFRDTVVLCDIEGRSHQDVATTLGIKRETVRSRLCRGRTELRIALAHRAPAQARRPTDSEPSARVA